MYKSLALCLLSIGSVLQAKKSSGGKSSSSSSSDSSSNFPCHSGDISPKEIDGTYDFTMLGARRRINVCTNEKGETYMSLTANRRQTCDSPDASADFTLGVFRDLNGVQSIGKNILALYMEGFQLALSGDEFLVSTYKIECDTCKRPCECTLIRNNGAEEYELDKVSDVAMGNCYEPGGKFTEIDFSNGGGALYRSVDLKGSGCYCASIGLGDEASCFDKESVESAALTDACFATVDMHDTPIEDEAGPLTQSSLEWGNTLSLEFWSVTGFDGKCSSGTQITIIDPNNTQKGGLVLSFRCTEGNDGYTYKLDQINLPGGDDFESCPL